MGMGTTFGFGLNEGLPEPNPFNKAVNTTSASEDKLMEDSSIYIQVNSSFTGTVVSPPDKPPAPDTNAGVSGASSLSSMISMAIFVAGITIVALN